MTTIPFIQYWVVGGLVSVLALVSLYYLFFHCRKDLKT
jgi:hypothetical protein